MSRAAGWKHGNRFTGDFFFKWIIPFIDDEQIMINSPCPYNIPEGIP
jgi:hypothetical protein